MLYSTDAVGPRYKRRYSSTRGIVFLSSCQLIHSIGASLLKFAYICVQCILLYMNHLYRVAGSMSVLLEIMKRY